MLLQSPFPGDVEASLVQSQIGTCHGGCVCDVQVTQTDSLMHTSWGSTCGTSDLCDEAKHKSRRKTLVFVTKGGV